MSEPSVNPNGTDRRQVVTLTRLGIGIWTVIGVVILAGMVAAVVAALSELMLPLVFAVMMGAVLSPLARRLQRRLKPSVAAMVVVAGSAVVVAGVVLLAVRAVVNESNDVAAEIDLALDELATTTDVIELDAEAIEQMRDAVTSIAGTIGRGLLTGLVSGVGAVIGLVGGSILAALILYYMLKDGPEIRRSMVSWFPDRLRGDVDSFLSSSVRSVQGYWAGRSVLSAAVTLVVVIVSLLMGLPLIATIGMVNFIGGFVPYIGAFIGGSLATLLALSTGGIDQALLMLVIVLVANLVLENLLEPRIMSGRLRIHPLGVLIATTAGGVIGGIMGLVLAVPVTVVGLDLLRRIRAAGGSSAARATADQLRTLTLLDEPLDP